MYIDELDYLNREAESDFPEQDSDQAYEEWRWQTIYDAYNEQQTDFQALGLDYLVMADLNGTEEPF